MLLLHPTSCFARIHFMVNQNTRYSRHILVAFDLHIVQHLFETSQPTLSIIKKIDLSDKSPFVGHTLRSIKRNHPRYEVNDFEPAIDFFEANPDTALWIASRLAFLKDFSCDHYVPKTLIQKLMAVQNG